MVLIDYEF